jgi:hypothetical protein
VLSGAPKLARRSAGKTIAAGLMVNSCQLPVAWIAFDKAEGLANSASTMPINTSGEIRQLKRPGNNGVMAALPLGALPMKADPCHIVPCASPSVMRPCVCFSMTGTRNAAGKNASAVIATLDMPSNNQSRKRRT